MFSTRPVQRRAHQGHRADAILLVGTLRPAFAGLSFAHPTDDAAGGDRAAELAQVRQLCLSIRSPARQSYPVALLGIGTLRWYRETKMAPHAVH